MTLVYVALYKDAHSASVMGVFTSATDAHEATKKHPRAWFEPCKLNNFTDFGNALVKIRTEADAYRPVGLVQVDRQCVSKTLPALGRKSSTEARQGVETKTSASGSGSDAASSFLLSSAKR